MATSTLPQTRIPQLGLVQMVGIGAAVVGLALLGLGFMSNPLLFAESYIFGFYFTMAFPLGCLIFLMIQHLTGGVWGISARRMLEAGALAMPVFFLLSLPVVMIAYNSSALQLGDHYVYHWADPSVVTPGAEHFDPLVAHKTPWLSPQWFAGRMLVYFVIWSLLAIMLRTWSVQQDRASDARVYSERMRRLSAVGAALFVLSTTFFALDVGLSLDAHWYSTMYGAHYMVNGGLATLAFVVLMMSQVRSHPVFEEHVPIKAFHDLGKLLFGFTVVWTYISYGQFVIIWSGDVAEFTPWFVRRREGGWDFFALSLMAFAFAGPFFALLGRKPKRNLSYLAFVAAWILVFRLVDMIWVILPEFHTTIAEIELINFAAPLGIFGIWLSIWAWNMQRAPILPMNDPNFDSLHAGGHH
ncbi:MAG: hypothetical protein EI684_12655 [Candidatus Viridilinea halotolerans]|uniref:Quinol:cytochrome C oxidoreductase n=1 Tax=Candidatus Viridilinea halotolerans TaxID=2491704 RepID=A0A426TY46_9CHLR|nr:MAG: hypothetical protein EI684_12655 [Candidatus Viridilinea halotolerans]